MSGAGEPAKAPPQIIRPPNKMKQKVTLGGRIKGGGFDADLLEEAEKSVAATLDNFNHDLDEAIERMVMAMEMLEGQPAETGPSFSELTTGVTAVAEAAKQSDYNLLPAFGESLNGFLASGQVAGPVAIRVARAHVDAMRLIYVSQLTGNGGEAGLKLATALRDTVAHVVGQT